jgi:hypothetical protein|nr:MAG TPA_asm: Head protein [Caudoviricetes sp.]
MARRIANSTLNATTLDILNVIRQNASLEYQSSVPTVTKATDIPKVGEIIYGTPAFANQFLNALVNRIAIVRVQSANFNNPYSILKKGYLEFGESVEDIFVSIAKVVEYTPEKGNEREFKRTLPDVRSAFHVMNWRVMYPVTIQDEDLKQAFLSIDGVQNLITQIVDSVYTAAQYDEFLLFKYLLIKAISHGKTYPVSIGKTGNLQESAIRFRGMSNLLPFMSNKYNDAGVKTCTPKNRQVIFMDAVYNARYDVAILAGAFNMDKADFMGRLFLIDDWVTFDNDRFNVIRANSDGIEEVTQQELALLKNVKAVILDENWFQIYDNNNKFTEKYVASGLYWNYFYHTWKTVSSSPFANAITFITDEATITLPKTITVHVGMKDETDDATVFTLNAEFEEASLEPQCVNFVQTKELTTAGIAVQPYGSIMIPNNKVDTEITLVAEINDTKYTATSTITGATTVDTTITLNQG